MKAAKRILVPSVTLMLLVMLVGVGTANAASDSGSHQVTFNNKAAIRITVPSATVDFGDVNPVTGTYTLANAVTVNVKCNTNWTLYVKGSGNFASGGNTIPLSRLGWQINGGGGYTAMTTSDAQVRTGNKTTGSGVDTGMDYRLTIQWDDDVADGYSTTITYTASTP